MELRECECQPMHEASVTLALSAAPGGSRPDPEVLAVDPETRFQPVKSADRTLEILETLAAARGRLSLGALARDLGIPKSSLHSILRTMQSRHWVESDPDGRYFGLGVKALVVGASYVESSDSVAAAQPVLDWLASQLGETVHLGRLDGSDVVYLAKRESSHPLRLYSAIGRRLPAHSTALGKALLAERRPSDIDLLLPEELPQLTPNTITRRSELQQELQAIRTRGYSIDDEENSEGIRCFAVTLRTAAPARDALSYSIPLIRLTPQLENEAVLLLRQARTQLEARTRLLGA